MTIYTVQHGQPQITIVKDPRQLATVREQLCTDVGAGKSVRY